ncbi:MAG: GrpB family protein [Cyanobacteria bacterium SZAS TMP-1]|nr:GrpB family protein [Cyanobacteria bacterium SZAS TMP-1]
MGLRRRSSDKITIVPYNPAWPAQFEQIAAPLAAALGALAIRIDHIGSTAVPGLAAKDRIDIQVTLGRAEDFAAAGKALQTLGYTQAEHTCDHVPPGGPTAPEEWEKRFFRPPANQRPTNLHVRVAGRANQRYPLLFRDYLRSNDAAARAYANLKYSLAQYHPADIEAYCDIKDPACDLIAIAAEDWAEKTGWQQ